MTLEINTEKIDYILQTLYSRDYKLVSSYLEMNNERAGVPKFHFPFLEKQMMLTFLEKLYVPNKIDNDSRIYVADKILSIDYDSSIVGSEILFAKKAEDDVRFRDLAKKSIDYDVLHDSYSHLKDIIIRWDDSELADYAIEKMTSIYNEGNVPENFLKSYCSIAEAFGKEELYGVRFKIKAKLARLIFDIKDVLPKLFNLYKYPDDLPSPDLNVWGIEKRPEDGCCMTLESLYEIVVPGRMQTEISEKADSSTILENFAYYIRYTSDERSILRNMRIDYLASIGEYKDASRFAVVLRGLDRTSYFSEFFKTPEYYFDLAQTYLDMQDMVDAVKVIDVK